MVAAVPPEEVNRVVALLDSYEVAWNANDPDAVFELFTDDWVYGSGYTPEESRYTFVTEMDSWAREKTSWEYVGDPVVVPTAYSRDGTYDVSALWVETLESTPVPVFGISVYRLVDEDGVLKISRSSGNRTWFAAY